MLHLLVLLQNVAVLHALVLCYVVIVPNQLVFLQVGPGSHA